MDNFMDKLTTKQFNAGELIKANGEAEERELNRVKELAEENDKLLQEIRRLNLKNVELTEQVGQLIQCGIEQFEEYDRTADKTKVSFDAFETEMKTAFASLENAIVAMGEKTSNSNADSPEGLLEAVKALEEHVHKENVKVYRNVQAVIMDQSTQRAREMGDRLDALERNAKKNSVLMPLAVITFLAATASLIIQLAGMFQLF